jgi:hypothetical protein
LCSENFDCRCCSLAAREGHLQLLIAVVAGQDDETISQETTAEKGLELTPDISREE